MNKKTFNNNIVIAILKNIMIIIFPLITFPYISKTLNVESIGRYNFIEQIISCFSLIAMLGINSYAIREGARLRENKKLLNKLTSELLFINLIAVFVSYIIMFIFVENVSKLCQEKYLIYLFSVSIIFDAFSVSWLSTVYEKYIFQTLHMFCFKVLYIIFLFLFVKKENDFLSYMMINVIISIFSYMVITIYNKQFYKIQKISIKECIFHLKPIFTIFFSSLASMIYTSSDIIILGFMTNNYIVGIYSFSVKIYNTLKTFLSCILSISYPRVSFLYGKKDFSKMVQYTYDVTMLLMLPCIVGLILIGNRIILLIGNELYLPSIYSLYILTFALFFAIIAWIQLQLILLPSKKDSEILKTTIFSAILNILLNIVLIPFFKEKATAFSTLVSELVMCILLRYYGRNIYKINLINKNVKNSIVSCLGIIVIGILIPKVITDNSFLIVITTIVLSMFFYILILVLQRNEIILNFFKKE